MSAGRRSTTAPISAMRGAFVVFDVLYRRAARHLRQGPCPLCPQHHRCRGQDQRRGPRERRADRGADRAHDAKPFTTTWPRSAFCRPMSSRAPPSISPQMIAMIERLIASGHAYAAEGHVLFAVASDPGYGQLSGRSRDEMIAGARVEVAPYKRDPADFVLWKPSTPDMPGWDSPWGRGRPGWHIECSAMSEAHLGETFDIHGGGLDLIFPHHENEIAQSVCAHQGRPFVRYWVHNGFLSVDSAKMSKSLGNFFTVRELLDEAPGEAIRLALLSAHYRDPLDWTDERLRQARQSLDRFYRALTLSRDPVFERFGEADEALRPVQRGARRRSEHAARPDPAARARRGDQPDQLRRGALGAAAGARRRRPADGPAGTGPARLAARQRPGRRAAGSRSRSRCGRPRDASAALPRPTRSAPPSPPRASCSKTSPTAPPPGGGKECGGSPASSQKLRARPARVRTSDGRHRSSPPCS